MKTTYLPIIKVSVVSVMGVMLFHLFSLPMPWMLGPLFAVMLSQLTFKTTWGWPVTFRNIGLVILGTTIGEAFTVVALKQMDQYVLYMVFMNIILIMSCILLAMITQKVTGVSLMSALTASIPGGLSQSVAFAEEHKNIDIGIVTFFQVVRVISIVSIVPFLVSGHTINDSLSMKEASPYWAVLLLIIISYLSVAVGKKIKLPVPYFLMPVILGIILNISGVNVPVVPSNLLHIAQLTIGAYIGLLLKPHMIKLPWKVVVMGLLSSILILVISYLFSYLLMEMIGESFATSFLSTAAGGMDQMTLIAAAIKADSTVVTIFQMFRLLFIYLLVLPALSWYAQRNKI
ncbi:AbrB family transcriptional regulator [Paenibacillus endoradicis]|uniref:AbrB family transcriptional regulator n=1 Tax=Paenibacillus endoradicis TaxID=2972487 RepID=UPI0021596E68|nr:AbrB family transcriptional regulator [Paenibacillus endoradicis]MCR8659503.1 AbrB family transcriptional regulator [Paenibacillus endoradicis]